MPETSLRTFLVVLATLIGAGPLAAQPATGTPAAESRSLPSDAVDGRLLDVYATIVGGWYLEQRCNFLGSEDKAEFEWHVAQMNAHTGRLVSPAFLVRLQKDARELVRNEPCGDKAASSIADSFDLGRQATMSLTGQRYSRETEAADESDRVSTLLVAQAADDQCRIMTPESRAELDARVARILARLEKTNPAAAERARSDAASRGADRRVACSGELLQSLLANALTDARRISPP